VFHNGHDEAVVRHARLVDGALDALAHVRSTGRSPSLLSMYRHEQLVPLLRGLGLHDRFTHVQGLTGPGGGHKEPHLVAHLETVAHDVGDDPSRVLLVGDALDDAHAAAAVGAACVLIASGTHPREELVTAGVPVVERLADAVALLDEV
jgi:phosphoglycolate phosphatase-like HAD superfamily hydrolase